MLRVALTGGIASGKSVVAALLEEKGCYIHRADQVAHQLMEPQSPAWEKIVVHFGRDILNPDKTINRAKLGKIVFADEKERNFLNNILHPLVLERKRQVIELLEKDGNYKIFVSEAALTIEAGFSSFFDKIVVTHCSQEIQIRRLIERDKISREEAKRKILAQMPAEERLKYADYIIDTSGTIEETRAQTEKIYENLLRDYEEKNRNKGSGL